MDEYPPEPEPKPGGATLMPNPPFTKPLAPVVAVDIVNAELPPALTI
jgi:hypothetical protein